jgi:RNase H-like domain found in reverse transcriptase
VSGNAVWTYIHPSTFQTVINDVFICYPYILTCDASDIGIGAVLEQLIKTGYYPVAFASRKLSSTENDYPVHEQEFLAIVYALK